jgi:predicted DNA-binding transcriptional regulator AlpA
MPEPVTNEDLAPLLARLSEALESLGGVAPEGLTAGRAATFVGVSVSKWHAMNSAGGCPSPIELGDRCPRWLRSELMAWLRRGAPSRVTWLQIREAAMKRTG